mmetsp:Transcript_9222/g.16225  ORF Transcript_9222/g.16225 Transcript_9222/m.16225 type:complete len:123 (+) Transcript_9222:76-444(+)
MFEEDEEGNLVRKTLCGCDCGVHSPDLTIDRSDVWVVPVASGACSSCSCRCPMPPKGKGKTGFWTVAQKAEYDACMARDAAKLKYEEAEARYKAMVAARKASDALIDSEDDADDAVNDPNTP